MSQIIKHSFEAVSLLTTENGMLDVTMIPAENQPDWIIPSSLILSVEEHQERSDYYAWQQQKIAVFHLLQDEQVADKIIIIEGNTDKHRIALQTKGELQRMQMRISEVKDAELAEYTQPDADTNLELVDENVVLSYLFQTVLVNDKTYLIPDLDKISHQWLNLHS